MSPPRASSSHRFLASGQHIRPRHGLQSLERGEDVQEAGQNAPPQQEGPPGAMMPQFAATPRFGKGRTIVPRESGYNDPTSSRATNIHAFRAPTRQGEDIDDAHSSDDDDRANIGVRATRSSHAPLSDELEGSGHDVEAVWTQDMALSPKRRKLDAIPYETPREQRPMFRRPQVPASPSNARSSSMAFMQTQESISTSAPDHETPTLSRPTFLPPPPTSTESDGPLPQVFSPHRRGHKFVPGGMASTVQQWVIEAGHAVVESRKARGSSRNDEFVYQVAIKKAKGCGPTSAYGRSSNGEELHLLFPNHSEGGSPISKPDRIDSGAVIGIRQPTWELQLGGVRWNVVVDWKVLT